ncbi:MAG: YbbR-like domain-containing protein [Gemmatimonadales bacterium]|nr:MAG: YbbR-like domain-containing protein [Gemmatimonadales bacterium]
MPNFSGFFTRNVRLKVSAFAVALLLWLSVQWEAPGRFQFEDVPVRVDLSDPDWVLVGDPQPAVVTVSLQGAAGDLSRTGRPTILVPMDEVTTGDTTVVLRSQWVRVQDRPGVGVEDIQPSTVRFTFEPVERRSIPLAFSLESELPEGLALSGPPLPAAQEVRVSGPRSRIAEMDSVRFRPLDLSAITETGTVMLRVDSAAVQGLQVQPPQVEVDVRIEDSEERIVEEVPYVLSDPELADEFESLPAAGVLRLTGARSLVERVDAAQLEIVIEVDPDALPEPGEQVTLPLRVRGLPDWVGATLDEDEVVLTRRSEDEEDPDVPDGEAGGAS